MEVSLFPASPHSINTIPGWPGRPRSPFRPAGPSKPGSPSLPGSPGRPIGPRTHKSITEIKALEISLQKSSNCQWLICCFFLIHKNSPLNQMYMVESCVSLLTHSSVLSCLLLSSVTYFCSLCHVTGTANCTQLHLWSCPLQPPWIIPGNPCGPGNPGGPLDPGCPGGPGEPGSPLTTMLRPMVPGKPGGPESRKIGIR